MSDAYVINSFSHAYLIPYFRKLIKKYQFKTQKEFVEKFSISSSVVRDVFTGLSFFRLYKKENDIFVDIEPSIISSEITADHNFRLYLLRIFRKL